MLGSEILRSGMLGSKLLGSEMMAQGSCLVPIIVRRPMEHLSHSGQRPDNSHHEAELRAIIPTLSIPEPSNSEPSISEPSISELTLPELSISATPKTFPGGLLLRRE